MCCVRRWQHFIGAMSVSHAYFAVLTSFNCCEFFNSQHFQACFYQQLNHKIRVQPDIPLNKWEVSTKKEGKGAWYKIQITTEEKLHTCFSAILNSVIVKVFFLLSLCRNPTYTFSGREARNSRHCGRPLGWEQTGPWGPWAISPAGSFCWRTSERVSSEQWKRICINEKIAFEVTRSIFISSNIVFFNFTLSGYIGCHHI